MIHAIFQRHHIPPQDVYNAPDGAKRFMYASMTLVLEEEAEERKKTQRRKL